MLNQFFCLPRSTNTLFAAYVAVVPMYLFREEFVFRVAVVISWICHLGRSKFEISGSHGGEYEDGCLLGCCGMWTGMSLLMFETCLLLPALKMEAAGTSETLGNFYRATHFRNQPSSKMV
jgi:hypothetical protein